MEKSNVTPLVPKDKNSKDQKKPHRSEAFIWITSFILLTLLVSNRLVRFFR